MPQVTKIRVVNFKYNDGHRFIADELFNLSDAEHIEALNTLFLLANGGGKSVLVQLFLQPVIPKAKVAGRRIEDFFSSGTDHSFVLLEWAMENSTKKLLTGIAMATSSSAMEDDERRGVSIKYYTFYSTYSDYTTEYDVINLPLSERGENDRFVPAEFDCIRKLEKKSNGALRCYSSDDNPKWQKKLDEFGIVLNEWKLMEKLNSEEGGMFKFFGDIGNSDQLMNRLLIPAIEQKINNFGKGKEDRSLSTMLISYVRQCQARQGILRERDAYVSFVKNLTDLQPEIEKLWSANERLDECVGNLFGLSDALHTKIDECKAKQDDYTAAMDLLTKQAKKIEHERESNLFYEAEAEFVTAQGNCSQAETKKNDLSFELDKVVHTQRVLECARDYQELCRISGQLDGIRAEIARQENGGEYGSEVAALKYSVYKQVSERHTQCSAELASKQSEQQRLYQEADICKRQLSDAKRASEQARIETGRIEGRLISARNETDREVSKFDIDVMRHLDGTYSEKDLLACKENRLSKQKHLQTSKGKAEEEKCKVETELLTAIPKKKVELSSLLSEHTQNAEHAQMELNSFFVLEEKILAICEEHGFDFALRFTDSVRNLLGDAQSRNQLDQTENTHKISVLEEEIAAAKRGSLHIPSAVINYLDSTNVKYQTCEKYFARLIADEKVSNEQCLAILRKYPAFAFGVLMENSEKERFFEYGREDWLPAAVPLFTYQQMEQILEGQYVSDDVIAFYSEKYFRDTESYIENLEMELEKLYHTKEILLTEKDHLEDQMECAKKFDYHEGYSSALRETLEREKQEIATVKNLLEDLETQRLDLSCKREDLDRSIRELDTALNAVDKVLDAIESLLERIKIEARLEQDLQQSCADEVRAKKKLDALDEQMDELDEHLQAVLGDVDSLKTKCVELEKVRSDIGSCEETEVLPGEWEVLYERYTTTFSVLNEAITKLKHQRDDLEKRKKKCESDIDSREIAADEYRDMPFSDEHLTQVRVRGKELSVELNKARVCLDKALEAKGKAEGKFNAREQDLKAKYGNPLDKSEVGTQFAERLEKTKEDQRALQDKIDTCRKFENDLASKFGSVSERTKEHSRPKKIPNVSLEESLDEQFTKIVNDCSAAKQERVATHMKVEDILTSMRGRYNDCTFGISEAIKSMYAMLISDAKGDRVYSLSEQIDGYIENSKRAISQINTDLTEFDASFSDLWRQCVLQGKRIHEGLLQMASSSRVKVYEGVEKKHMIRFDMPNKVDPEVAAESIRNEVLKGVQELLPHVSEGIPDDGLRKIANRIVDSQNLLRKYIGKESIRVEAYKIDQNPYNAGYRSWELTRVRNSGAQKNVIYFAVILSLMNYSRSDFGGVQDKDIRRTLILDNPFGTTSSKHILDPMFRIAKHFHVQMICVSDINKSDILNCFDNVIQAVIKRVSSHNEILSHEGNEKIEHGFYRSKQLAI